MFDFILNKPLSEHHCYHNGGELLTEECGSFSPLFFRNDGKRPVYTINTIGTEKRITTSYFIGIDWLVKGKKAIRVDPKIDTADEKTDYLRMFLHALKHSDISPHTDRLYEIKFEEKSIEIKQEDDLLSPLLICHFIQVLKEIVVKGLRRDYVKTEKNLSAQIKGKVLVSQTIRRNLLQSKTANTYCRYDLFSVNCIENRVLKKALLYCIRYLSRHKIEVNNQTLNFLIASFENVSETVELKELQTYRFGGLYKNYNEALKLAKYILKRFGFNINNISNDKYIKTPPFWIDMSLMFELYVLGLLKDRFGSEVGYHFRDAGNELDFVLNSGSYQMVVDAKYKPRYIDGRDNNDIRQVSGYARLKSIYAELGKQYPESIDCLLIFPDQRKGLEDLSQVDLRREAIEEYWGMYKLGVKLPSRGSIVLW